MVIEAEAFTMAPDQEEAYREGELIRLEDVANAAQFREAQEEDAELQ